MSDLKHDPVINAIQKGIKDDIDFNLRAERFRATLILTVHGDPGTELVPDPAAQQRRRNPDHHGDDAKDQPSLIG
jgi:hypothetical protein